MTRSSEVVYATLPKWVTILAALAAGGVLYLAFPGTGWWPLGVVAVAVVYVATGRDHAGWNFLLLFLSGLTFALPHVRWALYATALVPWLALSLLVAVGFGVFGAAWTWARRLPCVGASSGVGATLHLLVFATVWVSVEQWRSEVPFGGFPWGRLAWSVAGAPVGRSAWLAGTPLTSWLMAASGVLLVYLVVFAWRRETVAAGVALAALVVAQLGPLLLPLPTSGGADAVASPADALAAIDVPNRAVLVDADSGTAEKGLLRVGLVQGNVPDDEFTGHRPTQVLRNHLEQTKLLADDGLALDLVVWPENSADFDPQTQPLVAKWLDEAVAEVGAPILVGAMEWPDYGGRFNVLLLWDHGVISRYAKQHPAPFGEYIPLRGFVRLLTDQVDRVTNDMWAATNPPLIHLPSERLGREVVVGVGICFEVAYDRILRDATRRGAEILVVPTNNASFGYTSQSTQQLQMTRLQAIANGRATIQISTNGVSAVIAPDGTVVARTGLWTADHVAASMPLRSTLTPAAVLGYWPGWIISAGGGLLAVAGLTARWWRRPN